MRQISFFYILECGVEFSADKLLYEAPCRGFNKRFMDYGVSHFNSATGCRIDPPMALITCN